MNLKSCTTRGGTNATAMLVALALAADIAAAATNSYLDNQTQYSNQDPATETRHSDHFRVCFGHYNRDSTAMTEQFAQGNLRMYEHLWRHNIVEMGLNDMGQSADLAKRDGNYYRVNFNFLMTWNDGGGGGSFMSMDANGFSYAMSNPGNCRYDPPSGATPHELGHCWEGQARGFDGTDSSGAWWECTANWFMLQLLNSYPQAAGLIWNSMYYPAHGRDYYDSWPIWEAAREDVRYGAAYINNVWTNATDDQQVHEFIIDRMVRLDSSGLADKAGANKDLWGDMAKKCVTWDYERQQWLKTANSADDGTDWYFYQRCRTPLVKLPGAEGWYRPSRDHLPMEYGFNIIPLAAVTNATVGCLFQPQCEPVRQSDWRASLVAVNNNGEARYSCFWNDGTNSMTLSTDETRLYLVVIATPKPMKITDPVWAAYTSDAGAQFPYALWFANATPKNVIYPVYTGTHTHHPNGGGIVQNGATVDATAYVGTNAMVLNTAKVRGYARIEDYAVVMNSAVVSNNAVVSGHAVVMNNAAVYGNAKVRDWARVFGYVEIYENAKVIEHANCGDGSASTHTKVFGNAVVKGTTYVYDTSTFGGSLIVDGDSANGNGTSFVADHGVHFGWGWGQDIARFTGLVDNNYLYAQHAFEKDNAVFAMDEYGINHGFLMNGCRIGKDTGSPPRGGRVLPLDGTNQYVELYNSVNDFRETAIMLWAKWTGATNDQRIWSMGDGAGKVMYLTPKDSATGNLRFSIGDGTTTSYLDGVAPLTSAAWVHVAVVFSGTTNTLYVNGAAVGVNTAATLFPDSLNAPLMENANYLGRGNGSDYFQGSLDDFRVYSKALSAAEIAALYSAAAPSPVTITPDTTAPTPNAATWLVNPVAISDNAVAMSATPGTDASGWVEYYFACTAGGGHDSGWVSFNKYTDVGLGSGTVYTYTVKMRDRDGNTTVASAGMGATTQASTTPSAAFAYGPIGIANGQITMTAARQTSSCGLVEYKFDRAGKTSGWQASPTWTDTGLANGASYTYAVTVRDGWGNTSAASVPATTQASDLAAPGLPIPVAHWTMLPYATIDDKVSMTAQTASDPSGVQYCFKCTSGGAPDSAWQNSATYVTPVLTDGTYSFQYQLKDKATPANTSAFFSTTYSATITPTTGFHPYTLDQIPGLPDDYLVSFTGTVMHVTATNYYLKDIASGTGIVVKTSAYAEATTPSLVLKNALVKGHLYTLGGARIITFASVTNAGTPATYTISGTVTNAAGAGIVGATVYFSDVANPSANPIVTATTIAGGTYSKAITPGTWYVAAGASAYNTSADRIVTADTNNVTGIDFGLVANARASGSVVKRSDGSPISGATVYFSRTPGASASPMFTTNTDVAGNFTQPVQDGTWYVCAAATNYYTSGDKTLVVSGVDVTGVVISLKSNVRNIPGTNNLLFAAITDTFPPSGSTGPWTMYYPTGTMAMMASPTVTILNGTKWEQNVYADGDGFRQGTYASPIAVSGVTVVAVVKPMRNGIGTSWTSVLDIFYDRLVLGVKNDSGLVVVRRNGGLDLSSTAIPDGQITVLSLVVQPNGTYAVWANGVQIMSNAGTSTMTNLVNGVAGGYANSINVGRNDPDGWTTFNGNIGDVFVYKVPLSTAERLQLELDLYYKFMYYTFAATAGTGGTISPSGAVYVDYNASQSFAVAPDIGYIISNVVVDSVARGPLGSYTFTNVTAGHTIAAAFSLVPEGTYIWTGSTDREWSTSKANWAAGAWSDGTNALFTATGAGPVLIAAGGVTAGHYVVFSSGATGYSLSGGTLALAPGPNL